MIAGSANATRVAVLGTGTIGSPVARNLLAAGFDVHVWNRSEWKLEPLAQAGAIVGQTPRETVEAANYVITTVADGRAVENVMSGPHGAAQGMAQGALWLQMSTVGLGDTERFANLASYRVIQYVDAPVLGSRQPAEKGELVILASGPDSLVERCKPVFEVLGRKTLWLGPVGAGTRMKLVLNTWLTNSVAVLAEAIGLAQTLGVEPEDFFSIVADSVLNMPYAHVKGRAMVEEVFEPAFALRLAEKDLRLILEAAAERDLRMPVTETSARQYQRAGELGHSEDDLAAVYYAVREPSGVREGHGRR